MGGAAPAKPHSIRCFLIGFLESIVFFVLLVTVLPF